MNTTLRTNLCYTRPEALAAFDALAALDGVRLDSAPVLCDLKHTRIATYRLESEVSSSEHLLCLKHISNLGSQVVHQMTPGVIMSDASSPAPPSLRQ